MSPLVRRTRGVLALAAFGAAMVAGQGVAAGATINGAWLEGRTTGTTSPPASVLPATVDATIPSGENWRATRVVFEDLAGVEADVSNCIGTDSTGSHRDEFNVTAPGPPARYNVIFVAHSSTGCNAPISAAPFTLINGLRVTQTAANPNLPARCGVDVMLVLDSSGSIGNNASTVVSAARGFLVALSGTGSQVGIVDFDATGRLAVPYETVNAASLAQNGPFETYLRSYTASGTTNWEDAFQRVVEANNATPVADLVMFITDGDPNTYNTTGGTRQLSPDGNVTVMRGAAYQADLVKDAGSHVFALGVGAAVSNPNSQNRLTAVSGPDKYPQHNFGQGDYGLVTNIADLPAALKEFATQMCKGSLTITKLVDEGDGVFQPDQGWTFRANVTTNPGFYEWISPAPPPPTGERTATTDKDGIAAFQWRPSDPTANSQVIASEELEDGYENLGYECRVYNLNGLRRRTRGTTPGSIATGNIGPNQYAKCTVRNRILPGTIEIEKQATPEGSQAFAFTGSLGSFSLVDRGGGTSSSRIFTGLAPGTYSVTESVPANWSLSGASCSTPTGTVAGATATITVTPETSTVCTFRNNRNDTPPEPPTTPIAPEPPPRTRLRVVKTAPAVTRVGRRVSFKVTVTNTGPIAARDVVLADIPPASLSLAGLRTGRRVRVLRGNAVWRLGTLAPGAKRTVRGSVRVSAGSPGLKRNLVLASAVNANLARDVADTRLRAAQRGQAPAVTG